MITQTVAIPMEPVAIGPDDVVTALGSNDEAILGFITGLLLEANSVDLRERLQERLANWDSETGEPTDLPLEEEGS